MRIVHPASNLPKLLSSFIGREREVNEIKQRLATQRLVTLTGPGGAGKTRLALQTAHELRSDYRDGIWLAELAPVTNPDFVAQAITSQFNLREQPGHFPLAALIDYFSARTLLLILDNCEHVIAACAELAENLLIACPSLYILATSREPLGVAGESVWNIPPLSLPQPQPWLDPGSTEKALPTYLESEAVRLFIDRAGSVSSAFSLAPQNGPWIAEICRRLDGMPLAIELAAARVRALSVQQIAERLDDRFHLLTRGSRTAPLRHQTLEAAIDWSYMLLSELERKILQRLSVFSGGYTLHAAEAICAGNDIHKEEVLAQLSELIDKSLVNVTQGENEARYWFLETIRQYAYQKLVDTGEEENMRNQHLNFFLAQADLANARLLGPEQLRWIAWFEAEHDNLRAALDWSRRTPSVTEKGLTLAVSMGYFWRMRGYLSEGRTHLLSMLALVAEDQYPLTQAQALYHLAALAYLQSDYPATRTFGEKSLEILRMLGEPGELVFADMMTTLGELATEEGDYETAPRLFEEALVIFRKSGHKQGIGDALMNLGWAAMRTGRMQEAVEPLEEALAVFRETGNARSIGIVLGGLGELAIRQGRYGQAMGILEESLLLHQKAGGKWAMGTILGSMGWVALRQGAFNEMRKYLGDSIAVRMEIGDKGGIAWCLEKLGEAVTLLGQGAPPPGRGILFRQGARNYGAAAALRLPIHSTIDPTDLSEYDRILSVLRIGLGDEEFENAWQNGKTTPLTEIIKDALAFDVPAQTQSDEGGLSARERETALWIAQGLSNREIAEAMTVRVKTVETYITRILNKLGFDSRVQIATWVIEHGLTQTAKK